MSALADSKPRAHVAEPHVGAAAEHHAAWMEIPLLASTRLRMELALGCDVPDLGEIARIVRSDPAAVLRLFALSAGAMERATSVPRLEEVIAHLGGADLLEHICREPCTVSEADRELAQRACALAGLCKTVAEAVSLPGDTAYLVGLLQNLTAAGRCAAVSRRYRLPLPLHDALFAVAEQNACSPWMAIILAAQDLLAQGSSRASCKVHF